MGPGLDHEKIQTEFLATGKQETQSAKGGWLNKENYYRKESLGPNVPREMNDLTEADLGRLSKEQLRKNKEQLLTDILCGIPDSL